MFYHNTPILPLLLLSGKIEIGTLVVVAATVPFQVDETTMPSCDILIAGVMGVSIARALTRRRVGRALVLEKSFLAITLDIAPLRPARFNENDVVKTPYAYGVMG